MRFQRRLVPMLQDIPANTGLRAGDDAPADVDRPLGRVRAGRLRVERLPFEDAPVARDGDRFVQPVAAPVVGGADVVDDEAFDRLEALDRSRA